MNDRELLEAIEDAARTGAESLALPSQCLTALPPEIGQLTSLNTLHLSLVPAVYIVAPHRAVGKAKPEAVTDSERKIIALFNHELGQIRGRMLMTGIKQGIGYAFAKAHPDPIDTHYMKAPYLLT